MTVCMVISLPKMPYVQGWPKPYDRIYAVSSVRRISGTVFEILTVYDRIWTVFAGGTPQTRVQFLAKATLLFLVHFFFLAAF